MHFCICSKQTMPVCMKSIIFVSIVLLVSKLVFVAFRPRSFLISNFMCVQIHTYVRTYVRACLRTHARTLAHTHIRTYAHTYIHTDGRTDGRTDRRTDGQTDRHTDRQTHRQTAIHASIHPSINPFIHPSIHTYIYTYIQVHKPKIRTIGFRGMVNVCCKILNRSSAYGRNMHTPCEQQCCGLFTQFGMDCTMMFRTPIEETSPFASIGIGGFVRTWGTHGQSSFFPVEIALCGGYLIFMHTQVAPVFASCRPEDWRRLRPRHLIENCHLGHGTVHCAAGLLDPQHPRREFNGCQVIGQPKS